MGSKAYLESSPIKVDKILDLKLDEITLNNDIINMNNPPK